MGTGALRQGWSVLSSIFIPLELVGGALMP